MTAYRLILPVASLVFFVGMACDDASAVGPEPAGEMRLTLTGTVRMPDGSPATGVIVEATDGFDGPPLVVRADRLGRFEVRGVFGAGARLYARSAEGNHQTTRIIPSVVVRSVAAAPIELTLAPAIGHEVVVLAGGRPVERAEVVASGQSFRVRGATDPHGKLSLRLPVTDRLAEVSAWHRRSGVRGVRDLDQRPPQDRTELSLLPPGPLWIRAVAPEGHPVPGLELGLSFLTENRDWAVVHPIEAARVRTGDDGTAIAPWAPREKLLAVDPREFSTDWKIDGTDLEQTGDRVRDRVVTIHLRRLRPVEGRLVMPAGASPEGLLITGFGFGPKNNGDIPYARARADGSFTLRVPSDHGYMLGVADTEWASEPWTGTILGKDADKPADVKISVSRATPVTVRVTRGPDHSPVADAWVEVGNRVDFDWVDSGGKKRSGQAGMRSWMRTDASGLVRAGAGRGHFNVRMASTDWDEERTIDISSDRPVEVAFHRPWAGKRQVAGRLLSDGKPFRPSSSLVARAWTPHDRFFPKEFKPEVNPDGTFKAVFDAESLSLFFSDTDQRQSGFATIGLKESSVAVNMVAMAADGGTVRDPEGRPLTGQPLGLYLNTAGLEPVATVRSDESGRFRFPAVPARVPLQLQVAERTGRPEFFVAGGDRLFEPGEVRENDTLDVRRIQPPDAVARPAQPSVPLADRIDTACRNIRSTGMLALVVLRGEDSGKAVTSTLTDRWLDPERTEAILRYLPVRVDPEEVKAEAEILRKYGWAPPAPGQVVLFVMDGHGATVASKRIQADPSGEAMGIGDAFLKKTMLPARDARAGLAAARDEARKTGRRVWVIHGGPRCGPCFRLGRWIDDHHAALEKDFVIFKVMGGLDQHANEVIKGLPESEGDGIPWHAFTEPDGTILATSHGPLGNIGFPGSVEDLRHFRRMLDRATRNLTKAEVDGLVDSLSSKR
jgi:hypothetical protein